MRLLTSILWLALAATAHGAVTITGPTGPVPVDRYVVLPFAGAQVTPQVKVWPKTATAVVVDVSFGRPYIVFQAGKPGSYEVEVIASRARVIPAEAYDRCLILVGDEDEDEDDEEDEDEDDDDPPPPPANALRVQIVWEMRDADPLPTDQVLLFNSPVIKKWIDDNGHRLERRDVDAVDDDGKPVVSPAPDSLPVVRLYDDESSKLLWEGLPKTEAEFLDILRKHCASCQQSQATPRTQQAVKWRLFPGRR